MIGDYLLDLDLAHHSDISMSQLGICYRHLTMQHVTPRNELFSQPDDSVDVMAVEHAA